MERYLRPTKSPAFQPVFLRPYIYFVTLHAAQTNTPDLLSCTEMTKMFQAITPLTELFSYMSATLPKATCIDSTSPGIWHSIEFFLRRWGCMEINSTAQA